MGTDSQETEPLLGDHDWPLTYHYHRCERCGYVIENRKPFHRVDDEWEKQVSCQRCGHTFFVVKRRRK